MLSSKKRTNITKNNNSKYYTLALAFSAVSGLLALSSLALLFTGSNGLLARHVDDLARDGLVLAHQLQADRN